MPCSYPPTDKNHYFKCMECQFVANCPEIKKSREMSQQRFDTFKEMHNRDLEGMLKYYFDEHGWHWDGQYDKVKKNKYLTMPPKAYCYAGNATHPKFFKCESCEQYRNCQLGYYVLERKRQERERRWAPVKKVIGKIAEVVESLFRR